MLGEQRLRPDGVNPAVLTERIVQRLRRQILPSEHPIDTSELLLARGPRRENFDVGVEGAPGRVDADVLDRGKRAVNPPQPLDPGVRGAERCAGVRRQRRQHRCERISTL